MSRIDSALEKAARLRAEETEVAQQDVVSPEVEVYAAASVVMPRNSCLVTVTDPVSPAAEEYRKLKAMVIKLSKREAMDNVIVVTSCASGEGKSLTAINLAVSLAEEVGRRALLVDADLRRSSLAGYLGIDVAVGLSDCLMDGLNPFSVILSTGIPNLHLLPAGKSVRNPVELLSSPKMRSLCGELKRRHADDFIIIDTPPVLPFAETQVLSMLADSVLFVVKEGSSTVQDLQEALEAMRGNRLLGVVFNDVVNGGKHDRYRHYYHYYAERKQ